MPPQYLKPFPIKVGGQSCDARDVATRTADPFHEAEGNGVIAPHDGHDRNGGRCGHRNTCSDLVPGNDDVDFSLDKLAGKPRKSVKVTGGRYDVKLYVPTILKTQFTETDPKVVKASIA
jgi:hypothetical protein